MNVIICEDEKYWIQEIKSSLLRWSEARGIDCNCSCFSVPKELITYIESHKDIDLLLLDISLGEKEVDGMTLAKHIRKIGSAVPIIFITSDSTKAAEGYLVEAVGFLSKPIDDTRFALFLDKSVQRQKGRKTIKLISEGHMINIFQKDINYVEIDNHTITFHTVQGNISLRGTLAEVLAELDETSFVQIHRSYVVALDKINSLKTNYPYAVEIVENNKTVYLPVSRKYKERLIEKYSDDILEKII